MARTLTLIQDDVRFISRDDSLIITSSFGLEIANRMYRILGSIAKWPELRVIDESVTTVDAQNDYTWPSAKFKEVQAMAVEVSTGVYELMHIPENEWEWNRMERETDSSRPLQYMRYRDGSTNKFTVRPAPDSTGKKFRITGYIEPALLTQGSDSTIFINSDLDDALVYLIAGEISGRDGIYDNEKRLYEMAARILRRLVGKDILPEELGYIATTKRKTNETAAEQETKPVKI